MEADTTVTAVFVESPVEEEIHIYIPLMMREALLIGSD
jgi:hypothetical protein